MFGKKNEMSGMEQGTDGEERRPIAVLAGKKCQLRIFDLPVTIGRNSEMVDVPLVEYSVSRRHCALELLDENIVLVDLGSYVGTFVERHKLQEGEACVLQNGQTIRIGKEKFKLTIFQEELMRRIQEARRASITPEQMEEEDTGFLIDTFDDGESVEELEEIEDLEEAGAVEEVEAIEELPEGEEAEVIEEGEPEEEVEEVEEVEEIEEVEDLEEIEEASEILEAEDMPEDSESFAVIDEIEVLEEEEETDAELTEMIDYAEHGGIVFVWEDDLTGESDRFEISKDLFVIGRQEGDVDHVIQAKGISRKHCYISKRNGGYYIYDMQSTNGVTLNGEKIDPEREVLLEAGDTVQIGERVYTVEEL
ncbi:FHA domain-containing protein [Eubacterium sp. AB3007]|uniref:FHA domain-containing protein n=1 Tax=Eubacterium sp. AB3007 TaxID=1392487 RepID=UPI000483E973|nr:FHA domain-containing protein [Eubacterium sp. AB3007]MBQ1471078.1 FHA domain-containing protein [Eubacterium sp.]